VILQSSKPEPFFSHGWNTDETRTEKSVRSVLRREDNPPNSVPALEPNLVTNVSAICVQSVFHPWLNCIVPAKSLSENSGVRLCRPRPAAARNEVSARWIHRASLRLVFDTAALLFRQTLNRIHAVQVMMDEFYSTQRTPRTRSCAEKKRSSSRTQFGELAKRSNLRVRSRPLRLCVLLPQLPTAWIRLRRQPNLD